MKKINCFIVLSIILLACSKEEEPSDLSEKKVIVKDIDGNEYTAVTVDGATWLWENLRTSRYQDGTPIPEITDNEAWASTNSGASSWFNNINESGKGYGKLYNWEAATCCAICPEGYRLPTLEDFYKVIGRFSRNFCERDLECTNYTTWITKIGTGEGKRNFDGSFLIDKTVYTGLWTNDSVYENDAPIFHIIGFYDTYVSPQQYSGFFEESKENKKAGLSIKCIKIQ